MTQSRASTTATSSRSETGNGYLGSAQSGRERRLDDGPI